MRQNQQGNVSANGRLYLQWCIFLLLWGAVYLNLQTSADWLSYDVLSLNRQSQMGGAVAFFLYDTPKILMLLVLMVYVIAIARADLNVQRVRTYLMQRQRFTGYLLGAGFGAITPFCSCSSVPLFIGFTLGGIPLGATMAFLITSPIINEVAVVLLWGILGWQTTLLYVGVGLGAGVIGGFVMDAIGAGKWLQLYLLQAQRESEGAGVSGQSQHAPMTLQQRHAYAVRETRTIFQRVWVWVIVGVGAGALLHGFVPSDWVLQYLAADNVWAVPGAVALGVPLYTNVTGIVPVMESLLLKGLPLGTTLAFCMSSVAVSLPELMMLKQVMRYKLLAVFTATLVTLFVIVGWLLNAFVLL